MKPTINIFWFRRDLRLEDNAGLFYALKSDISVLPIFIFDTNILSRLEDKADKRVQFIYNQIQSLQKQFATYSSGLKVFYSTPLEAFKQLADNYNIVSVFANRDYEQYGIERDDTIAEYLKEKGIKFNAFKDQVIFEKKEIVKDDNTPYTVFTPYSRKWKAALTEIDTEPYNTLKYITNFYPLQNNTIPFLSTMGFNETETCFPADTVEDELIQHYTTQRDYPGIEGTSRLGVHLRFGTISNRALVRRALLLNETFLNELIWRDFYQAILWNFPYINQGKCFKKEYEKIIWRNNEDEFSKWCNGQTGYPIVDAGMRELNTTGYMHNRVRMITASFLTKHLLIDWRWGEAYFASKLLDFDFAANNGGWQWAAGCGCDAAPYFRVFNPTLQTDKFDKDKKYINKWIPELNSFEYPAPIVLHEVARKRVLEVYNKALKEN